LSNFEIVCSDEEMLKIEEHCFSETRIEVGGFLVGKIEDGRTIVTQAIAAKHTVGQSTQLTFTHDTWNAIYSEMAQLGADVSLIGWYHSHPNFGVFLSEHDQFIQNNFFKNKGQITIVVDPVRGRRGWFRSVDGKIVEHGKEEDTMKQRLGVSATNPDANMDVVLGTKVQSASNLKIIAISGFMAILSFVAGLLVNNLSSSNNQQVIIQKAVSQVEQMMATSQVNATVSSVPNVTTVPNSSSEQRAYVSAPKSAVPNGAGSRSSGVTAKKTALGSDAPGNKCLKVDAISPHNPSLICDKAHKWVIKPVVSQPPAKGQGNSNSAPSPSSSPSPSTTQSPSSSPSPSTTQSPSSSPSPSTTQSPSSSPSPTKS
jgi:proteasome lid subunit RPN8/RPN11